MTTRALVFAVAIVAVNVFDIAIHVAGDMVEPLRITGNVVVILAAVAMIARPVLARPAVSIAAGTLSLALNLVFIALSGSIGGLGAALIAGTTVLFAATAWAQRSH